MPDGATGPQDRQRRNGAPGVAVSCVQPAPWRRCGRAPLWPCAAVAVRRCGRAPLSRP